MNNSICFKSYVRIEDQCSELKKRRNEKDRTFLQNSAGDSQTQE